MAAEKKTLKLQAYNVIKQKIIQCEYTPGTLLNEEQLREELQVSRTPIRDALSRLEQEGMITILPKKGIVISGISINDINKVFEVRLLYEPYALLNYGSLIPYETLTKHYQMSINMDSSTKPEDFFHLDDTLHAAIIHATDNRYLQQSYEHIHGQNVRFRELTGQNSAMRLEASTAEHLKILSACLKRDWKRAAYEMEQHLIASKNVTFDLLLAQMNTKI